MLEVNFTPFPNLKTERLVLRQLKSEDKNELYTLRSDKRVNEFLDRPGTNSVDDAIAFIQKINTAIANNESLYWAITLKNEKNLIGTICLWNVSKENYRAELGYELLPDFQGKGIMNEALFKVIDFGFQRLGLKMFVAYSRADNLSSRKLLEKNNFEIDNSIEAEQGEDLENMVVYSIRTPNEIV
jgi:ribosomal-protein-alanine N-acetyltransferase